MPVKVHIFRRPNSLAKEFRNIAAAFGHENAQIAKIRAEVVRHEVRRLCVAKEDPKDPGVVSGDFRDSWKVLQRTKDAVLYSDHPGAPAWEWGWQSKAGKRPPYKAIYDWVVIKKPDEDPHRATLNIMNHIFRYGMGGRRLLHRAIDHTADVEIERTVLQRLFESSRLPDGKGGHIPVSRKRAELSIRDLFRKVVATFRQLFRLF